MAAQQFFNRTAKRTRLLVVGLAMASLVASVASTFLPALLGKAVDEVVHRPAGASWGGWPALFAGTVVLSVTADALSELLTGTSAAAVTARLRHELLRHVLSIGPALRLSAGDVSSRVVSAATEAGVGPSALVQTGTALIPPVGAVVALAILDPWLALTLLTGLPLILLMLRAFVRDTSAVVGHYLAAQGAIAARLVETLSGSRTIAAAGTADREIDRILTPLPELSRYGHQTWKVQAGTASRGTLAVPLLQVAVLAVAGIEVTHGRLTAGGLLAAVQYAALGAGIGPMVAYVGRLARARAGMKRITEVLDQPVPSYGTAALPKGPGRLEFRAVRLAPALDGIDLVVPAGQAVALVGRSGTGKSLLARLAGRLADPDSGEVLLDGVPLGELDRTALREAFAYAFEQPVLFGATIEAAIAPTKALNPAKGGVAVCEPARAAQADAFIRRLPAGYQTPLDEAPMSGGERQRIGLARAFAQEGRVLILDDATSNLDTVTELQIGRALTGTGGPGGRTRLIVAHRAATAARADLVAWLDDGRIRAVGRHDDLWADPDYRSVFQQATP